MRFIFIGGCGRSGTTLVQKALVTHSKIAGGPEFDHVRRIIDLYEKMSSKISLDKQRFYYTESELRETIQQFTESFFRRLEDKKPAATWISEKTPANIQVADKLLSLFDDAVFVFVQRDGRDVALSHKRIFQRFLKKDSATACKYSDEYSVQTIAKQWNNNTLKYLSLLGDTKIADRVYCIRYEDFVREPEKILGDLCRFLGISLEQAQLHPENMKADKMETAASVDGVWYTNAQYEQPFNASSIGGWRFGLSIAEKLRANIQMSQKLNAMGYEVNPNYLLILEIINKLRGR